MTQAISFERYFDSPQPVRATEAEAERESWRSWESWLTLTLVILVQLPVVGSLQSSNWVDEMPSLMAPASAGLLTAWVLGHTRLRGLFAALLAVVVGVVSTTSLVMQTMVLADPLASGFVDRQAELRLRLLEWGRALIHEGISTDPLPFVFLLVSSVFLVAFISTWAVVRWRSPWIALVPGGFVLLTNISYLPGQPAFSFIVFVLAAILLVVRLTYLRALVRWRREGVRPSEGMSVEVLLIGGLVALALISAAWLIPTANNWGPVADTWGRAFAPVNDRIDRLGQLFVGIGSKKPVPVHALGAALPLQGEVFLNDDPLFEVTAPEEVNLRGATYDEYTGQGWRLSSAAAVELLGTTIEAAELGTPRTRAELRRPVKVEVTVLSDAAPVGALLAAGDPITTDTEARLLLDSAGRSLALAPSAAVRPGSTYASVGTVSAAAIPTLLEAGTDYPASILDRYTAVPASLPPEVAALTASVIVGAQTPYEAARLVETYLRQNYTFAYDITPAPPGQDAVDYFLFDSRTGYFDQFSSAMAIMLRTQGIPTRVSAGFALDESDLNAETKAYVVTEQNAWSWPEVYFPGLGWVEFNPTPNRAVVARPGDDTAAREAAGAGGLADPEFDALFDDQLLDLLAEEEFATGGFVTAIPEENNAVREFVGRVIGWTLAAATLVLVLAIGLRLWWSRAFAGLTPAEGRWARVQRLARWAGIAPFDDRTPAESAADLAARIGERDSVRALARSYTRARYGGPEVATVAETEEEAEALDAHYAKVRAALRGLIRRRLVRLGRVPGGPLARGGIPAGLRR